MGGFWRIFGTKMKPSWHQNRTKNPCEHRNAILRKSCSHSCGGVNFLGSGVQVGSKNRSKNEVMMGRHLDIDFSWILMDLGGQVGAVLGSKIDQNSIQEGFENRMRKKRRLGGVLEASWSPKNPPQEPHPLDEGARWRRRTPRS